MFKFKIMYANFHQSIGIKDSSLEWFQINRLPQVGIKIASKYGQNNECPCKRKEIILDSFFRMNKFAPKWHKKFPKGTQENECLFKSKRIIF